MGDPLVSIITPVLNCVETMGACLGNKADVSTDRAHGGRWAIYGWNVGAPSRAPSVVIPSIV
jgi:hypothetical protein